MGRKNWNWFWHFEEICIIYELNNYFIAVIWTTSAHVITIMWHFEIVHDWTFEVKKSITFIALNLNAFDLVYSTFDLV